MSIKERCVVSTALGSTRVPIENDTIKIIQKQYRFDVQDMEVKICEVEPDGWVGVYEKDLVNRHNYDKNRIWVYPPWSYIVLENYFG